MKKTEELRNVSLICIAEGSEYGTIKDFIVNSEEGCVQYLVIDDGIWYSGLKVLPFTRIVGMGRDAVTAGTEKDILSFTDTNAAVALARNEIKIIGTKVYSMNGKFIGNVREYFFEEKDGKIRGLVIEGQENRVIPHDRIITFGKNVIMVKDEREEPQREESQREEPQSHTVKREEETGDRENKQAGKEEENKNEQMEKAEEKQKEELSYEQRQRKFLEGRKASKTITDDNGNILVKDGDIITTEIIEAMKKYGKLVELTMNTKA